MVKLGKTIPAGDLFQLDDASSIPVWLQLKNRFIYLITSGFYLPGICSSWMPPAPFPSGFS